MSSKVLSNLQGFFRLPGQVNGLGHFTPSARQFYCSSEGGDIAAISAAISAATSRCPLVKESHGQKRGTVYVHVRMCECGMRFKTHRGIIEGSTELPRPSPPKIVSTGKGLVS